MVRQIWKKRRLEGLEQAVMEERRSRSAPTGKYGPGYAYIIQYDGHYKIGYSERLTRRLQDLDGAVPGELILVGVIYSDEARETEKRLHSQFAHRRVKKEWFYLHSEDLDLVIDRPDFQLIQKSVSAYIAKMEG